MTGELSPRDSGDDVARAGMRASHEDRDRVVDLLRLAGGEGRLAADELGERLDAALTARTLGELAALVADLPVPAGQQAPVPPARPRDLVRIRYTSGSGKRDGRWVVPRRMEIQITSGRVKLDFTEAVISHPELDVDLELRSGTLVLVLRPGIVVDADDVAVRSGSVRVRSPWDSGVPVLLRIRLSGRVGSGSVSARPPRRTFWQWLRRRPRRYALPSP